MRYTAQREYEKKCEEIENSNMDEYEKANALADAQIARDYIFAMEGRKEKEKEKEQEQQNYGYSSSDYGSSNSGCLIVGLLTIFTGLTSVAVAKSISNTPDLKPERVLSAPIENKQSKSETATLISKHNVITNASKNLTNEHVKN